VSYRECRSLGLLHPLQAAALCHLSVRAGRHARRQSEQSRGKRNCCRNAPDGARRMTLASLTKPWAATSYGFLDASAKRELRRKMLKAIAVPGCQMPYASREVPMARGWGTGGLQVTLTLVNPASTIKVIDQGA